MQPVLAHETIASRTAILGQILLTDMIMSPTLGCGSKG
jgi:hypothetical protein